MQWVSGEARRLRFWGSGRATTSADPNISAAVWWAAVSFLADIQSAQPASCTDCPSHPPDGCLFSVFMLCHENGRRHWFLGHSTKTVCSTDESFKVTNYMMSEWMFLKSLNVFVKLCRSRRELCVRFTDCLGFRLLVFLLKLLQDDFLILPVLWFKVPAVCRRSLIKSVRVFTLDWNMLGLVAMCVFLMELNAQLLINNGNILQLQPHTSCLFLYRCLSEVWHARWFTAWSIVRTTLQKPLPNQAEK